MVVKRIKKRGGTNVGRQNFAAIWSELSTEILSAIGKRFETRLEICKFRSVCKKWRAALPLPKNPNFLTPFLPRQIPNPASLPFNQYNYEDIDLVPTTVFLVKPLNSQLNSNSNGWILTVEERQPGKLRLLYPLSRSPISSLSNCSPKTLNISQFRVSQIGKGYCFRSSSGPIPDCKVVVCSNSTKNLSNNVTDFSAIVLYSMGNLFGLRLNDGIWEYERINSFLWFKDIICFKGTIYAVAGKGKLYVIDHLTFRVTDIVVDYFVCDLDSSICLVESCEEELLLVDKDNFNVYKLNEVQHKWEVVKTLGDRIMFLGFDGCFLVPTEELLWKNGNFVVSRSILNPLQSRCIEVTENLHIYISCLEDVTKKNRMSYTHAISCMLWPPPTWLSPEKLTSNRNCEQDEELQLDICIQPPIRPEEVPPTVQFQLQEQIAVNPPLDIHGGCKLEEHTVSNPSSDDAVHEHRKALEPATPENMVLTPYKAPQIQHSGNDASTMKFHGIDIQSDYVPVLEKVWVKYGDVVQGSVIRSCDTVAMALESLAKMMLILQSNTGKTLSEDQVHYLGSTLSDLQLMHLKVDWLVPFVEKALALHRSMHLEAILVEIDKTAVVAKEMEQKFLETIAEVKQGLEKDRKIVSDNLSMFGLLDRDKCLGDGLC